jgi:hypothetical protein
MSRSSLLIALCLLALSGCSLLQPPPAARAPAPHPDLTNYQALREWMDLEQTVAAMNTEQVVAALVDVGKPKGTQDLFYFGLLNQKLKTYPSWTQARDAFREVSQAEEITGEQRQLAAIMLVYNQSRINWYLEYQRVQADFAATQDELEQARSDNTLLEQKIQAITDLETSISTRKEQ